MSDELLGAEILGYDEYGDPVYADDQSMLGAFPRFPMRRSVVPGAGRKMLIPGRGPGLPAVHPLPMPFPGASGPAGGQSAVAFPAVTFTNTSALNFTVTTNPNRMLRSKKLVVQVIRSAGAVVEIPYVNSLFIGPINQFSDANPMPAEAFTSDNTFFIQGTPIDQGTVITINYTCSVNPGAGETISLIGMIACDGVM